MIAGIRPENFEDASLVGDARDRGATFKAKIDLRRVDGLGAVRLLLVESEGVESQELEELAARLRRGRGARRGADQVVARLDAASEIKRGEEAELWVDVTKFTSSTRSRGRTCRSRARAEARARLAAQLAAHQVGRACPRHAALGLAQLLAQALDAPARPSRGCAAAGSAG